MRKISKQEFGEWLRKTRAEAGFTLRKFCLAIGKSPTYISRIELGDFDPPAEKTLKTIARTLGLNEDEILAMVGKIDSDLVKIITENPVEIAQFLRREYNNKISDKGFDVKIDENFGRFFKKMRVERRIPIDDFCDKSGLAQIAIKGFEKSLRFPIEESRKRIAKGLGIDVEELEKEMEKYFGARSMSVEAKAKNIVIEKDKNKILEYHSSMHDDAGNSIPVVVKIKNNKVISVEKV